MTSYMVGIEIDGSKIKKIMERLTKAQEEIYTCYNELQDLGVLKIVENDKKEAATD